MTSNKGSRQTEQGHVIARLQKVQHTLVNILYHENCKLVIYIYTQKVKGSTLTLF